MAGNFENILDHQDCIPEEKLLAYIDGRLTPQEANRVEQHLADCEFCSDALEGLKMLDPGRTREIVSELNKKIDQRLQPTESGKVIPVFSFYRIAAIIVLVTLFGGGYWLMKNSKEQNVIALNQKMESAPDKDSVAAQFEAPAGTVSMDTQSSLSMKEAISATPRLSLQQKQIADQSLTYSSASAKEIKVESRSNDDHGKKTDENAAQRSDTFFTGNEVALSKVENANRQQASNAIEDYSSTRSVPAAEEKSSDAFKDKEAETLSYKKEKARLKENDKLVFDRAKSNYDQKNFDIAANDFGKLVSDTSGKYYDDSKWFLANCYMRTNKNTKARKLLQEISTSNSVHKREAFGLLQEK
jgi:anti-sigma factor RsiW